MIKHVLVITLFILLQACASVGSSEFSCKGLPDGTRCEKTSDLYNRVDKPEFATKNSDVKYENQKSNRRHLNKDTIGRNYTGKNFGAHDNRSGKKGERFFGEIPEISGGDPDQLLVINPPVADGITPQRMTPKKREFWIAPWIDRDDVYHGDQVLFVDIENEHWKNGNQTTGISPIFSPLN